MICADKVYDEYGRQMIPDQAMRAIARVNAIPGYRSIHFQGEPRRIERGDHTE